MPEDRQDAVHALMCVFEPHAYRTRKQFVDRHTHPGDRPGFGRVWLTAAAWQDMLAQRDTEATLPSGPPIGKALVGFGHLFTAVVNGDVYLVTEALWYKRFEKGVYLVEVAFVVFDATGRRWMTTPIGWSVDEQQPIRLVTNDPELLALTDDSVFDLTQLVRSIWALWDSERMVRHRSSKRPRKRANRTSHPHPDVLAIDVRAPAREPAHEPNARLQAAPDHRWMVRGHWRQQACGPNRTLRKRIFVAEHSAGPSDKPLRVRPDSQVVHVLRGDDG